LAKAPRTTPGCAGNNCSTPKPGDLPSFPWDFHWDNKKIHPTGMYLLVKNSLLWKMNEYDPLMDDKHDDLLITNGDFP
jgi:hypothetical protein